MFIRLLALILFCGTVIPRALVMINPAGDAKNAGRTLAKGYERGITLQIAERLQKEITERYEAKCVLTRSPGEEALPLQGASFANRLNVDFYLSAHVYREEGFKPKIFLYHLVCNPMVDFATRIISPLVLMPLKQAHFLNISKTKSIAEKMQEVLMGEEYKKKIDFYGPYGIPFKPLVGVVAPAVAIEIGLNNEDSWPSLIDPIVDSLRFLFSF